MSGVLYGGQLNTKLSVGGMIMNDYRIMIEGIDGGYRLTVTRGSEVQTMDILNGKDSVVDPTLSNSGEAADAKVVGEKIAELLAAIQSGGIQAVHVDGTPLAITDGVVNIPLASETAPGVVKTTSAENGITINPDGTMSINSISMDKIVQSSSSDVVMGGGGSDF